MPHTVPPAHQFASKATYALSVHTRLHHGSATALDYRCELCQALYAMLNTSGASEAAPPPQPQATRRH